jgi:predicted Zn-dependent protease
MKLKTRHLKLTLPLGFLAAVTLLACTTVPDTGRKSFNFIPAGQLNQMGLNEFEKYKRQKPISNNASQKATLNRVASRLVRTVPIPNAQWEFVLFEDSSPNAFALPGGKVGVNTGIFKVAKTEAQLAAVVGHELGHVVAGHSGERLSSTLLSTAAVVGLGAILNSNSPQQRGRNTAITGGAAAAAGVGMLRFSRNQELEADRLGALYIARAGYNPREAITLWQNFAAYTQSKGTSNTPEFLRTHPLDSTRIANLESFMPRAQAEYRP